MGPDLSFPKVFWEGGWLQQSISGTNLQNDSSWWLQWGTECAHHMNESCPRAGEQKMWLTCEECLRSQSTCEPSGTFHHHSAGWDASLWPAPSHWICRTQDTNPSSLPTWPTESSTNSSFFMLSTHIWEESQSSWQHTGATQRPGNVHLRYFWEWSQRKPTAPTIWLLLCGHTAEALENSCFPQAAPACTVGFSGAISHPQHQHPHQISQKT